MSFDPSRILYPHIGCGVVPCVCVREHKPLEPLTLACPLCRFTTRTAGELQEHHLLFHEQPLREVALPRLGYLGRDEA